MFFVLGARFRRTRRRTCFQSTAVLCGKQRRLSLEMYTDELRVPTNMFSISAWRVDGARKSDVSNL